MLRAECICFENVSVILFIAFFNILNHLVFIKMAISNVIKIYNIFHFSK